MTEPKLVAGRHPRYSAEALHHGVAGTVIVRCTITKEGRVTHCCVIQPVRFMTEIVVDALQSRWYTPVLADGQPIDVQYVFTVKMYTR